MNDHGTSFILFLHIELNEWKIGISFHNISSLLKKKSYSFITNLDRWTCKYSFSSSCSCPLCSKYMWYCVIMVLSFLSGKIQSIHFCEVQKHASPPLWRPQSLYSFHSRVELVGLPSSCFGWIAGLTKNQSGNRKQIE